MESRSFSGLQFLLLTFFFFDCAHAALAALSAASTTAKW
jgi:hypothetical protein